MEQAIIFCRTKLDCDNMEGYFKEQGGGPQKPGHQFSCVCLHSDRKPPERRSNLERFKKGEASVISRFSIVEIQKYLTIWFPMLINDPSGLVDTFSSFRLEKASVGLSFGQIRTC